MLVQCECVCVRVCVCVYLLVIVVYFVYSLLSCLIATIVYRFDGMFQRAHSVLQDVAIEALCEIL